MSRGHKVKSMNTYGYSSSRNKPRVLFVIPGIEKNEFQMPFSRRFARFAQTYGVDSETFFLSSRVSVWKLLCECRNFIAKQREFKPDFVHAQYGTVTALFCVLLTRCPVLITFRGSDLNPCPGGKFFRTWLSHVFSKVSARFAAFIFCVSRGLTEHIPSSVCCPVRVDPSGVDDSSFFPRSSVASRNKLGIDLDIPVVLFNAGKSPEVKRLDLARQAFVCAQKSIPSAQMVILAGEIAPDLIPYYMSAADCLLVTSDYEGSPTVVQEAMACNLVVVSLDVGDVRERLHYVVPSFIVRRDVSSIAAGICQALAVRIRSNGREHLGVCSLHVQLRLYRSVLRRLLSRRCAGGRSRSAKMTSSY